jgi:hypothetical protein
MGELNRAVRRSRAPAPPAKIGLLLTAADHGKPLGTEYPVPWARAGHEPFAVIAGHLLAITGSRLDPTGLRVDSSSTVRVKRKLRNFDALLVLSLTEIIRYGADAPQVARRLHAMLDELEATLPAERHAGIAGQRSLLEAAVSAALPAPFASVASAADREGLG